MNWRSHWFLALLLILVSGQLAWADVAPELPPEPTRPFAPSSLQIVVAAVCVLTSLEMCVLLAFRHSKQLMMGALMLVSLFVIAIAGGAFVWSQSVEAGYEAELEAHQEEVKRLEDSADAARDRNLQLLWELRHREEFPEPPNEEPSAEQTPVENPSTDSPTDTPTNE